MLVGIYRMLIPSRLARRVIAVILVLLTILLLIFPFLVQPEVQERGFGKGRGWQLFEP
jgi:succinate dehydrogenase hydrophobic anchor subunit